MERDAALERAIKDLGSDLQDLVEDGLRLGWNLSYNKNSGLMVLRSPSQSPGSTPQVLPIPQKERSINMAKLRAWHMKLRRYAFPGLLNDADKHMLGVSTVETEVPKAEFKPPTPEQAIKGMVQVARNIQKDVAKAGMSPPPRKPKPAPPEPKKATGLDFEHLIKRGPETMWVQVSGGRIRCRGCEREYDNTQAGKQSMAGHYARAHGSKRGEGVKAQKKLHPNAQGKYECEECGAEFERSIQLAGHLRTHNPTPRKGSGVGLYKRRKHSCIICGARKYNLGPHYAAHRRKGEYLVKNGEEPIIAPQQPQPDGQSMAAKDALDMIVETLREAGVIASTGSATQAEELQKRNDRLQEWNERLEKNVERLTEENNDLRKKLDALRGLLD